MKKTHTSVKVVNSGGTIGRGNSNRIYSAIAFFTKLSDITKVAGLPQGYTLNKNVSERNAFYCTSRYYPNRDRLVTMVKPKIKEL